jgi:hypothetical protein
MVTRILSPETVDRVAETAKSEKRILDIIFNAS